MDPHNLLKIEKKCSKIIQQSKYEKKDNEMQKWWLSQFQNMEKSSQTPFYKRLRYLRTVFPDKTIEELVEAGLEVVHEVLNEGFENYGKEGCVVEPWRKEKLLSSKHSSASLKSGGGGGIKPRIKCSNPYSNFMKKDEKEACCWRLRKREDIDKLHIIKKAKNIEENIASDFHEWFSTVGSDKKSEINKETILALFQITFDYPAATSMVRKIYEIGSVPEETARFLGFPRFAAEACIKRQLERDIIAETQKPHVIAFGQMLPIELRRKALHGDLKAKWYAFQAQRQDLVSMAVVWRGITQLQSTYSFCYWLLDHPEVKPPQFLVKEGFLNKKYLDSQAQYTVGSEELNQLLGESEVVLDYNPLQQNMSFEKNIIITSDDKK